MSGFVEKLNVQNCINSTENCVHHTYEISRFEKKLNVQSCRNSTVNFIHYTYGMSGFAEKLNVQTKEIQWEIMYITCTEFLDLLKN